MSTTSPQAAAAGEQAAYQAQLSQELSQIALPELKKMIGQGGMVSSQLASTQGGAVKSSMDSGAYNSALGQLNQGYGQAAFGNREAINYGALRSNERSGNVMGSALGSAATSLERDRQAALSNLQFQSASSSLTDYNQLLSLMGQGVNSSLGLAQGFSGAANAAIGGLSQNTQMGSTLGGASAGAGLGATIGSVIPGVGTVIGGAAGGLIGGVTGYLGGQ